MFFIPLFFLFGKISLNINTFVKCWFHFLLPCLTLTWRFAGCNSFEGYSSPVFFSFSTWRLVTLQNIYIFTNVTYSRTTTTRITIHPVQWSILSKGGPASCIWNVREYELYCEEKMYKKLTYIYQYLYINIDWIVKINNTWCNNKEKWREGKWAREWWRKVACKC